MEVKDKKLRIHHFSDTHNLNDVNIGEVDIAIHSGDCSNPRDLERSEEEIRKFISWYSKVPAKYKIFVPGNHDLAISSGHITRQDFESKGIILLLHESIEIEGIKFFGSMYTPSFGYGWAFNVRRSLLHEYWLQIPEDTDVLIVHGPPHGILDWAPKRDSTLTVMSLIPENCGCRALEKRINIIKPKLVLFGHIHESKDFKNQGVMYKDGIYYSNGSCVTDGEFYKGITSHGNIFEIDDQGFRIIHN